MISIQVNGEEKQLPREMPLAEIIDTMQMTSRRIAVELNQEIVPRSLYASTILKSGDVVEIVHAIGGG